MTDHDPPAPAALPEPPYLAVIFTSLRRPTGGDDDCADDGYAHAAARMVELAAGRDGFLGVDSARGPDGLGITVSYWRDDASITAWRDDAEHAEARRQGRRAWYESFSVHVARVERSYDFGR